MLEACGRCDAASNEKDLPSTAASSKVEGRSSCAHEVWTQPTLPQSREMVKACRSNPPAVSFDGSDRWHAVSGWGRGPVYASPGQQVLTYFQALVLPEFRKPIRRQRYVPRR